MAAFLGTKAWADALVTVASTTLATTATFTSAAAFASATTFATFATFATLALASATTALHFKAVPMPLQDAHTIGALHSVQHQLLECAAFDVEVDAVAKRNHARVHGCCLSVQSEGHTTLLF